MWFSGKRTLRDFPALPDLRYRDEIVSKAFDQISWLASWIHCAPLPGKRLMTPRASRSSLTVVQYQEIKPWTGDVKAFLGRIRVQGLDSFFRGHLTVPLPALLAPKAEQAEPDIYHKWIDAKNACQAEDERPETRPDWAVDPKQREEEKIAKAPERLRRKLDVFR